MPEGLQEIELGVFAECTSLALTSLPESLTKILRESREKGGFLSREGTRQIINNLYLRRKKRPPMPLPLLALPIGVVNDSGRDTETKSLPLDLARYIATYASDYLHPKFHPKIAASVVWDAKTQKNVDEMNFQADETSRIRLQFTINIVNAENDMIFEKDEDRTKVVTKLVPGYEWVNQAAIEKGVIAMIEFDEEKQSDPNNSTTLIGQMYEAFHYIHDYGLNYGLNYGRFNRGVTGVIDIIDDQINTDYMENLIDNPDKKELKEFVMNMTKGYIDAFVQGVVSVKQSDDGTNYFKLNELKIDKTPPLDTKSYEWQNLQQTGIFSKEEGLIWVARPNRKFAVYLQKMLIRDIGYENAVTSMCKLNLNTWHDEFERAVKEFEKGPIVEDDDDL